MSFLANAQISNITSLSFDVTFDLNHTSGAINCPWYVVFALQLEGAGFLDLPQQNITRNYSTAPQPCGDTIQLLGRTAQFIFDTPSDWQGKSVELRMTLYSNNPATQGDILYFNINPVAIFSIPTAPPTCNIRIDNLIVNEGDQIVSIVQAGSFGFPEYSIDDGQNFQSSNTFTGVAPGSYVAVARDTGISGCEAKVGFIMPEPPPPPDPDISPSLFFINSSQIMAGDPALRTSTVTRTLEPTGESVLSPNFEEVTDWSFSRGSATGATFTSVPITIGEPGIGECLDQPEAATAGRISLGNKTSYLRPQEETQFQVQGCDEILFSFNAFIGTNDVIKPPKVRPVQWQYLFYWDNGGTNEFWYLNAGGQFHQNQDLAWNMQNILPGEWVTIEVTGKLPEFLQAGTLINIRYRFYNADERGVNNPHFVDQVFGPFKVSATNLPTIDLPDGFIINQAVTDAREFFNLELFRDNPEDPQSEDRYRPLDYGEDNGYRAWRQTGSNSPITEVTDENRITQTLFRQVKNEWRPGGTDAPEEFKYIRQISDDNKETKEVEFVIGDAPINFNNATVTAKDNFSLNGGEFTENWTTRANIEGEEKPLAEHFLDVDENQREYPPRKIEAELASKDEFLWPHMIVFEAQKSYKITSYEADTKLMEFRVTLSQLKRPRKGFEKAFKAESFNQEAFN